MTDFTTEKEKVVDRPRGIRQRLDDTDNVQNPPNDQDPSVHCQNLHGRRRIRRREHGRYADKGGIWLRTRRHAMRRIVSERRGKTADCPSSAVPLGRSFVPFCSRLRLGAYSVSVAVMLRISPRRSSSDNLSSYIYW
ncbi:hypothetical protein NECAME_08441 [Necator americanus]|uniref:Uncharacterized protein n=1 Tax=Necator americanus TaxID=51031 RepID=W2THI5_NECAM|nr:hypothetical protein NECAME_08441 [Necator americanus]ETN81530.1 hypothetical protein NECAME_08441 [Necator americanus]